MSAEKREALEALHEAGLFDDEAFDDLAEPEQVFKSIWDLLVELEEGGLDSYLRADVGNHLGFVEEALLTIDAEDAATIVRQVSELFPDAEILLDAPARELHIEEFDDESSAQLGALDGELEMIVPDVIESLHAFAIAHADDLRGAEALDDGLEGDSDLDDEGA